MRDDLGIMRLNWILFAVGLACLDGRAWVMADQELATAIQVLRGVGPEGRGNQEAAAAWKSLVARDQGALIPILQGMDGANDLASNWLRGAADALASRALEKRIPLPLAGLGEFLLETSHSPKGRRLAYELLNRFDPPAAQLILPGLLHDPAPELRRDAIQRLMNEAAVAKEVGRKEVAMVVLRQALGAARDPDQLDALSKSIREFGGNVDLPGLFGFLLDWRIAGPFDSTKGVGFEAVYPPEKGVDWSAEYDGKNGKVVWKPFKSQHEFGIVDVNKVCGLLKEAAAYAYTEFVSDRARPVELRLGCKNAWKIWVNGKYLFGRDEYHRGMEIDQYRMTTELQAGTNRILVKLCQNDQKEDWTVEWEFQLRICDPNGAPVRSVSKQ